MPFPLAKRTIYRKAPLVEVICQFRFPTILEISEKEPSAFQSRIRSTFPEYERQQETEFPLPLQYFNEIPQEIFKSIFRNTTKVGYTFSSQDSNATITLTQGFLALAVKKYGSWDEFMQYWRLAFEALCEIYAPSYFTRIGLRYQNIIRPSLLGWDAPPQWQDYLNPHLLGLLSHQDLGLEVQHTLSQAIVKLEGEQGLVRIQYGLVKLDDDPSNETCYLLDNDFYHEQRTDINDALHLLEYFHAQSGRVFEWAITDKLRTAME